MKKFISLFLAAVIFISAFAFPVFAEEKTESSASKAEEYTAGFFFDRVYALIKPEYHLKEFTAADFDSEKVERIEQEMLPEDVVYAHYQCFTLYLREPSKENVISLILTLRESEYVEKCEPYYIGTYFPIYPQSPSEIPLMHGSYTVRIELGDRTEVKKNMLNNPYYQKYYDKLLAYSVSRYNQFGEYMGDIDYIGYYTDTYITEIQQYVTLIFETPESYTDTVRDYNLSILEKYFKEDSILYVGDTVFAAVVCVSKDDAEIIKGITELSFIGDAFFDRTKGVFDDEVIYFLGDVIGNVPDVTSADARYILRFAAGLEDDQISVPMSDLDIEDEKEYEYYEWLYSGKGKEKLFYFSADINMDNAINAQDARLALRTAAGLEPEYRMAVTCGGMQDPAFLFELEYFEYFGEFPDNV